MINEENWERREREKREEEEEEKEKKRLEKFKELKRVEESSPVEESSLQEGNQPLEETSTLRVGDWFRKRRETNQLDGVDQRDMKKSKNIPS